MRDSVLLDNRCIGAQAPKVESEPLIIRPGRIAAASLFIVALTCAKPGWALDQRYGVSGRDTYRIGATALDSTIVYAGVQRLTITRSGRQHRFSAVVRYVRRDQSGSVPGEASFVQELSPAGNLHDRTDRDPDYLTVLNQPFAIELDSATLGDILHLRGRVPFNFPSPMTGGSLRGFLQRGAISSVDGHRAVGISFDSVGPMVGPLPDHSRIAIHGTMRMQGTAYYAIHGAILLALNETLKITGTLDDKGKRTPVAITYARSIKADDSLPAFLQANK